MPLGSYGHSTAKSTVSERPRHQAKPAAAGLRCSLRPLRLLMLESFVLLLVLLRLLLPVLFLVPVMSALSVVSLLFLLFLRLRRPI